MSGLPHALPPSRIREYLEYPSIAGIICQACKTASIRLDEPQIRRLITDAGWRPQKRDHYYRPID